MSWKSHDSYLKHWYGTSTLFATYNRVPTPKHMSDTNFQDGIGLELFAYGFMSTLPHVLPAQVETTGKTAAILGPNPHKTKLEATQNGGRRGLPHRGLPRWSRLAQKRSADASGQCRDLRRGGAALGSRSPGWSRVIPGFFRGHRCSFYVWLEMDGTGLHWFYAPFTLQAINPSH